MLKFGNIVLTNNSNWLNIPEHNVITSGNHGTVTASPNKGIQGTEVTLSNSPESGYEFSSYSVTGATLKNDNQFDIGTMDVNVNGNFTAIAYTITYNNTQHGSITGPATSTIGSTVTVTATPSSGYELSYITVNGVQIVGNSFVVTGDTVVGAVFAQVIYTVTYSTVQHGSVTGVASAAYGSTVTVTSTPDSGYTLSYITVNDTQIQGNSFVITGNTTVGAVFAGIVRTVTTLSSPVTGGSISASPNSGIIGTEVTLSNTPAEGYNFNGYVISGATLSGNTFTIGNSDVSVTGNFLEDIKYTVTCTNDGNGTIAASPTSNYSGSTVTLSNTPNSGYDFDSYTLISGTGASISGNILTIGTSNVTVRGNFARTVLPAGTIRVRTSDGQPPFKGAYTSYETATLVQGTSDIYDVYKSGTSFEYVLGGSGNVVEILDANTSNITNMQSAFSSCPLTSVPLFDTSNVTNMKYMFSGCTSLTSVPLFDTSNVTYMNCMFWGCTSLTSVPLFNTSKVRMMETMFSYCTSLTSVPLFDTSNNVNMAWMFNNCTSLTAVPLFDTSKVGNMQETFKNCSNVQSGALALYQQASTQANPPTNHKQTFYNCGSNTTTGAAELAQIPSDWK